MYTGWLRAFKIDRKPEPRERYATLPRSPAGRSNALLCVISLNSTYMDMIDRRFRLRGMVLTTTVLLINAGLAAWGLRRWSNRVPEVLGGPSGDAPAYVLFALLLLVQFALLYWLILRRDFFTYKYYPIRFNRRTRMVHAYTDGGPDAVISVPWEEAHFHVGEGKGERYLRDIRCHVLDGEIIRHTFAVGHYFDDEDKIREVWEFIRRYMDEGPASVLDAPAKPQVDLSVADTWKNCHATVVISLGQALLPLRGLLMPVLSPLVACRWLVLKSSRQPVWPQRILDESVIDTEDPHRWPEPQYIGQFDEKADGRAS